MISLKHLHLCLLSVLVLGAGLSALGQTPPPVRTPRPSQKATVMQTIGVTDVTITYSRPGVKGRKIWGDPLPTQDAKGEATLDNQKVRPKDAPIVPWGHAWRTGANEATQFVVTDEVLINGEKLPAGSYSLHTIPGKDEWTIIFNSVANQWGSFQYDPAKDMLRVKAKPEGVNDNQEWLMYSFDPVTDSTAQVNIRWEKIRVPFTVEIKDVKALTLEKARALVAAAPPKSQDSCSGIESMGIFKNTAIDAAIGGGVVEWLAKIRNNTNVTKIVIFGWIDMYGQQKKAQVQIRGGDIASVRLDLTQARVIPPVRDLRVLSCQ